MTFKGQLKAAELSTGCIVNGASYDQSLYETYIVSHIWPLSLPYNIWPWKTLKGKIKVIEFLAVFFISAACYD